MPKYFCDYCDTYLTHDSPSVRKTHNSGRKHKENVKFYYTKWMEDQAQKLIDQTIKQAEKSKHTMGMMPGMAMMAPPGMMPPGMALPPGMMLPPPVGGMPPIRGQMIPPMRMPNQPQMNVPQQGSAPPRGGNPNSMLRPGGNNGPPMSQNNQPNGNRPPMQQMRGPPIQQGSGGPNYR